MIKKLFFMLIFVIYADASSIKIALAANVSYAIGELKEAFYKKHLNIKVDVILGSSGKLTAQIKNGAPFDIFLSANMKYPDALVKDGIAISNPRIYAKGALAMFSVKKRDFSKGISIINDKSILKIAVANPKTAPYGKAAIEAIKNAKIYNEAKNKFVFAQSISQTVEYAMVAADIGFIAKSSLYSPKMKNFKKGENWIEVDKSLYTPIEQGIVMLKEAKNNKDAKTFYNFIFSKDAKKIFKKYGYLSE